MGGVGYRRTAELALGLKSYSCILHLCDNKREFQRSGDGDLAHFSPDPNVRSDTEHQLIPAALRCSRRSELHDCPSGTDLASPWHESQAAGGRALSEKSALFSTARIDLGGPRVVISFL